MDEFSDQIGGRLLEAREQAGLSVDDVLFKTRIPRSVIEALEAGDFSVFSSPTYAKSFLSQYSKFLNVEADLWLDALQPASFISGENVNPLLEAADTGRDEREQDKPHSSGWFSALILFGVTCGVVFAAIKGYEFFESRFGNEPGPTTQKENEIPVRKIPTETPSPPVESRQPSNKKPEEALVEPPPRAIIVRP